MAFSRFGASKYRNAAPYTPPREEWYRSSLPSTSSNSASTATSSFSSEIKTNRQLIVTVTPTGDISWRKYEAYGKDAEVYVGKVGSGGGVGDWDIGRVEGGELVVGGLDGSISLYNLDPASTSLPSPSYTTSASGSPVTSICLHPTVPSIVLSSSIFSTAAIWDFSASPTSPTIQLEAKEPKGMWSLAWSADGRLVAGIGRSGTAYIWEPRTSTQPTMSRLIPIQPLKPARVVWVGEDIFVTSTSKTRNREYHLFSTTKSLTTVFTQNIDTNTAPLIPTVDHERKIVYLAGKGDMTLRQVELSGPNGYQETLHSLPYAISSAGIALASPTTLPVMQAQIATVLIPVVDKDGDAVLPFGIRVPRRQLIDFHEDLYPDIAGFLPEGDAKTWLAGEDKNPLPISLDPARRTAWETVLEKASSSVKSVGGEGGVKTVSRDQPMPAIPTAPTARASNPSTTLSSSDRPVRMPDAAASPSPSATSAKVSEYDSEKPSANLPPLQGNETSSSTEYKARIIALHIHDELTLHRKLGAKKPMFVGLQGPQGCGKTTLCNGFVAYLKEKMDIRAAVLSLDDLYHTNANLKALAAKHPNNHLLSGRGPPGTHDVDLAKSVLTSVCKMNEGNGSSVDLPIFDKSLCNGEGDRSEQVVTITGPIDVFILEGWSMGFSPLTPSRLSERYSSIPSSGAKPYFASHSLDSLSQLNQYLSDFSSSTYPFFSTLITVVPTSYDLVFAWRLEQEHAMKESNGGKGMNDEQVRKFVERYMPGYELWREGIWERGWSGLELRYGRGREVLQVRKVEGKNVDVAKDTMADTKKELQALDSQGIAEGKRDVSAGGMTDVSSTANSSGAKSSPPVQPSTPASPAQKSTATSSSASKVNALKSSKSSTESSNQAKQPYNPGYSRKFLAAKSPLIPTYDSLPPLATLHPDSIILKCTRHLAFFPIQGPGGRLAVHPVAKKGRMPVGGQGYLSGGVEIADFAVDPFETEDGKGRVAVAGEDGAVRVWTIGKEGIEGPGPEPDLILKGQGIDKIAQVSFHPTAKDLLVLATNDNTSSSLRFFDMSSGKEVSVVPLDCKGIFNFTISPDGTRYAVATKDGQILILDPRKPDSVVSGKAHDSPRSFQLAWISSTHLVSIGFNRGSQRRINLYTISSSSIATAHSMLIDISPSVLFPTYDPDTRILYVWGKGERAISAYEVDLNNAQEPISKLPTFTAGEAQVGVAFKDKVEVDVRKVEVMRGLRLTGKTIEEVTFSIPRNKPEFFQDDIYVDTTDTAFPVSNAQEWLEGKDVPPRTKSLRPEGMTPLSQAPKTTTAAKAKFVPAKDIMTEEEKKRGEMDRLFEKAKADESSDEEVVQKGLAPPDDDW